ncbi:hypothetical protein QQ045_020208 [Rhodiola kirilowii]
MRKSFDSILIQQHHHRRRFDSHPSNIIDRNPSLPSPSLLLVLQLEAVAEELVKLDLKSDNRRATATLAEGKELVWQDDDYIRPIKDITSAEWEEAVLKDISPLIVFVHNRYRRAKENENVRNEIEKVVHVIWNCGLPSPRVNHSWFDIVEQNFLTMTWSLQCVAVDAIVELDLVSALKSSVSG